MVQTRKLRSSNLPLIVVPISKLLFFFLCMTCNFYAISFCSVMTIIKPAGLLLQHIRPQWKHFKAFSGVADGRRGGRSMEKQDNTLHKESLCLISKTVV